MRKIIIMFFVCFSFVNNSFSQNNYNWITPNKTYLKLFIDDDGIYRISSADFSNAGITPSGLDPRTVKVLYKGNQIPIYFKGEDDGSFDANDYLDFYGTRNYGGPTPHLDGNSNVVLYTIDEYFNQYSDTSIYWIEWGGSNGLRMERSALVSSANFPDNNFFRKVHFEKDAFYSLGETINSQNDFRYFSTEIVKGEGWFWQTLSTNGTFEDTTYINDLSPSASICSLKVFIKPVSFTSAILNEHRIEILINDVIIDTLFRNDLLQIDTVVTFQANLLANNSTNKIAFHYIPLGSDLFSPVITIDFFDLYYQRDFSIRNNKISINLSGSDTTSKKITLSNYNQANEINIYDVKNNIRIENGQPGSGTITFSGKSNSSFRVINEAVTKKPFRVVQRQVRDLVSANNTAEYLIVYHKLFESQSEQLKDHRSGFDNLNVFKAEIEDIYDVFNYGMENPVAVRYFVKNIYETWTLPKLKFVCLFGRASLDPKQNSPSSIYYHNFVPTYGNPPTDGYFVNFNLGSYTYYHQIAVGRVPVYNVTEAQNAVTKIINYDLQPVDNWVKKYLAITGGSPEEQPGFQAKSNTLIDLYIKPTPVTMNYSKIYRNDSTGYITFNYKDSIKREIDRGTQIINFIGHAAAQDWEIGLEDPNTLSNGSKQPLVLSFTCFTGKNSEPNFRSFGENWFLLPNKCAIGFVGTTGWSFSGTGNNYDTKMIEIFSKDSVRTIGEIMSYASQSVSSTDSNSFAGRNTINCYNLIGDPATKLLISKTPEFDLQQDDYTLSNPFPAIGETVKLSVFPKNLGTYVDTVRIRFQLRKNNVSISQTDTLIRTFAFIDTVNNFFAIDSIGNYTMSIVVDPNKDYPQLHYDNDSITFPLTLRNLSYVPIKPLDNSVLSSGSFKFTGLNPNVDPNSNNIKLILQVDTIRTFNSGALQTYNTSSISGISTNFEVNLNSPELNTLYFIRTNAIINNDSSGWSDISRVIYNPNISDNPKNLTDSVYTIYSVKPAQFNESEMVNVSYNSNGYALNQYTGELFVKSFGSNGNEASYILIGDISYYSDGGGNTGYNFAKLRRFNGQLNEIKNFRMDSPQSSDSVLNFLNTFDSTYFIIGYYASYVPGLLTFSQEVKNKLKEFGSIYADSLRVQNFEDNFDTWAFIGYLGADSTQTCEQFHRFLSNGERIPLECQMNPSFQYTSGMITQTIGTADNWRNLSWDQTLFPNSSIKYDVYGIDSDQQLNLLYSNLTNNAFVNLDTINFYTYPNLKFDAKLDIDSSEGTDSPVLLSSTVRYVPPAELIPDNNSFTGTDTIVQEGDSVRFSINYYNVGYIDAPVQINKWYANINGAQRIFAQDTIDTPLKIDSLRNSSVSFSTSNLRDNKVETDTIDLYFETTLAGKNELFSFNNIAITRFIIIGDTVQPVMDITYDGQKIQDGDFVPANPNIVLEFYDNSRMVIQDTTNVKIYNFENNTYKYVPYYINGIKNPVIDITFPDNNFLQATVSYTPSLEPGVHKFRYVATDISGNFADSVLNLVKVDNNLRILDIANYPNPMQTQTNFLFMLQGQSNPTTCIVKIYTVAGRLVKEINANAVIGYNSIGWDGRDNDGDYIANGVYLYKFIIQGDSQTETSTQKLAVLR